MLSHPHPNDVGPFAGHHCCGDTGLGLDLDSADLDDRVLGYLLEARPAFTGLRQGLSQLAGMLVLAAAGASGGVRPEHPMIAVVAQVLAEAADRLRASQAPDLCRHLHRHLLAAAIVLEAAAAKVGTPGTAVAPLRALLDRALAELERASALLPGFDLVDRRHACCAPLAAPPRRSHNKSRPQQGDVREPLFHLGR
jgi:hypothetical protein